MTEPIPTDDLVSGFFPPEPPKPPIDYTPMFRDTPIARPVPVLAPTCYRAFGVSLKASTGVNLPPWDEADDVQQAGWQRGVENVLSILGAAEDGELSVPLLAEQLYAPYALFSGRRLAFAETAPAERLAWQATVRHLCNIRFNVPSQQPLEPHERSWHDWTLRRLKETR